MSRKSLPLLSCVALFLAGAALPAAAHAAARPATHTHPLVALHVRSATDGAAARGTTTTSSNWSGYDDSTDGPFTTVTATWVQPAVKDAGAAFTDTAFWVGIDGDNSDTVEQIGTEGYSQGIVGYDAWYEMYPAAPVPIELSIHPGDVITAVVSESGAMFTLSLADTTTGASYQTLQAMSVPPLLASAEVIAEAPSDEYDDVVDLADFATMTFTDCAFDGQPISDFDWNRIDMASDYSDSLVDQALPLDASGTSFSVTTDVTPPRTVIAGDDGRWHRKPVTLHLHATDPGSGSGVAYSEYSLDDGATWTQGDSLTIAAPADHGADGVHKVAYRSVDQVGNVELKRFCSVRIDTSRPTPAAGESAEVRRGDRASLSFRIDDPRPGSPTATATIRIVDSQGRLARRAVLRATVDRVHRYTFRCTLPKGRYRFTVTAVDAAGNRGTAAADGVLLVH